ncbi:hypothetical protein [Clostridium cylindrosporum]|uniref:Uncharacterized protein n=1 Tax=Clostridium cylindrosporum DSM 605 TaxID=1121307 RepID=A0A0J8D8B1_CLOCY|nr:hypothetical protein [Clostridium cylindrosporum]KMT22295.1 hypothetical protein CLCY_4c02680 [Clostridium cylindrosporum DSM 605]
MFYGYNRYGRRGGRGYYHGGNGFGGFGVPFLLGYVVGRGPYYRPPYYGPYGW